MLKKIALTTGLTLALSVAGTANAASTTMATSASDSGLLDILVVKMCNIGKIRNLCPKKPRDLK